MTQDDIKGLVEKIRKFVRVRSGMTGMCDEIHGLQYGTDDECVITQSMLSQAAQALEDTLWRDDMENAPDDTHIRGVWVESRHTGQSYFDAHVGYIDDNGEFVGDDEEFGWGADDYSHWKPLSPPAEG